MNIRTNLFFSLILLASSIGYYAAAQDETDALRYSNLNVEGTARSIGFGSALGSIGGDFSSLSVNPAGIGVYRSSEVTFTPSLRLNKAVGEYLSQSTEDDNTRFNINNLGAVFTNSAKGRRYKKSDWKSVSFGIGFNRIADFNRNYSYQGVNNTSSGSFAFESDANLYPGDIQNTATLAGLGYNAFLLDTSSLAGMAYETVVPFATGINQLRTVEERGGISDITLSLGGNYQEKLMIGATLGVPSVRYNRTVTYTETDQSGDTNNNFESFTYNETLKTRGTGVNLKLGIIYKITEYIRAGAAFHTPTYYSMTDVQNRYVVANTENYKQSQGYFDGPVERIDAPTNEFEYSVLTPWRGIISGAAIIGKRGFVTADYEYVNYRSARVLYDNANSVLQNAVRDSVRAKYQGAHNFRIGAEGRFDMVFVRLGFGYNGSPFKKSYANAERIDVSGGIGFRFDRWFADLGYRRSMYTRMEQPYSTGYTNITAPTAEVGSTLNNVALTLGVKF